MTDRIALVTGANKGIGLEIARQLAQAGVLVIIGARDAGRASAAVKQLTSAGLKVESVAIDLDDHATIVAAAASIEQKHGKLDILVNNAGIVKKEDGLPSKAGLEAVRNTMKTNFLGPVAVTQTLLPLLQKSSAARIINVSSVLGSLTDQSDPSKGDAFRLLGYNSSKAALNMLTVQLAHEFREAGFLVNSVCPGWVKTDINDNTGQKTPEEGARIPVKLALLGKDDAVTGKYFNEDGEVPW